MRRKSQGYSRVRYSKDGQSVHGVLLLKSEEQRWSRSAKLSFAFALVILVAVVALIAVGVFVDWWPWDT